MKKKIAWITDSTSSLSKEFVKQHAIHVIPLNIAINGTSYKENIDLTATELYDRMQQEDGCFQTSLPSIGEFVELYTKLKEEYEFGIAIHVSSKLSGTYQTSIMAAEMVGFPLYPIDSLTGSYPLACLIHKGVKLAEQELHAEDIVAQLNLEKEKNRLYILPANLKQLHNSGRVSGSQKLLASLFHIKPILAIEDGEAQMKNKVRSQKKAIAALIQKLKDDCSEYRIEKVAILHANDLEKANELQKTIQDELNGLSTEILMLASVAGVHTGAKTIGLSWIYE